jgi:hypothetical protein
MPVNRSFKPDLKELFGLLLGFLPWMLFLFLAGHTLTRLETAIILSLATAILLGFRDLRDGFILQWGTVIFFSFCFVAINLMKNIWIAEHMDLISNASLGLVMWFTVMIGKPFALQYARRDLPKERWNDPHLVKGCNFITIFWASLMTFAAAVAFIHRSTSLGWPDWVFFTISILIIITGLTFTTVYKRNKRLKREEQAEAV